VEVTFTR